MTLILQGVPSQIGALVQNNTLERVFHDSLFPRLLYRGEAVPELWPANLGERQIFTRTGLMEPSTDPLVPGQDPLPGSYDSEQWSAEAAQYGKTIATHMPTSYVALASTFLRNTQALGLHAGNTMNRLVRNRLFQSYLGGEAMVTVAATTGVMVLAVSTLNGFTERLNNGQLSPVSPANPLPFSFSTAEPSNAVVGYAPNDPAKPFGPGVIYLQTALAGNVAVRVGVLAATRSRRTRVGGGATVDALTTGSILTLQDIINAVTRLRTMNVPPHSDGYYHVQLTPRGEAEIFADTAWRQLFQGCPESVAFRDLAIGMAVGCIFYRNTENPTVSTVNAGSLVTSAGGAGGARLSTEIGGEVTNEAGLEIQRALVTGGGVIYEKYLDESRFITEAGVNGKIGQFSIVNGGVSVMVQRVRYILRGPAYGVPEGFVIMS